MEELQVGKAVSDGFFFKAHTCMCTWPKMDGGCMHLLACLLACLLVWVRTCLYCVCECVRACVRACVRVCVFACK